jgi:sterol desaturase/sphingolipid hydroxylase (fatty acid hydroxylase superfamily)
MNTTLQIIVYGTTLSGGVLLWICESLFPFFRDRNNRKSHAVLNLSLGAVNLAVMLPAAMLCAWLVSQVALYWKGTACLGLYAIPRILLSLVLLDLWLYAWHRMNHEIGFFWHFHSIHHSDDRLDVTSAWRFHFGEIAMSELFRRHSCSLQA